MWDTGKSTDQQQTKRLTQIRNLRWVVAPRLMATQGKQALAGAFQDNVTEGKGGHGHSGISKKWLKAFSISEVQQV